MVSARRISSYVAEHFSRFGVNKQQEIARLSFEICRREKLAGPSFLRQYYGRESGGDFAAVKAALLQRRFPQTVRLYAGASSASAQSQQPRWYLPALQVDPAARRRPVDPLTPPQEIIIEEGLESGYMAQKLTRCFPQARVRRIVSLKAFLAGRCFSLAEYNRRRRSFFVARPQGMDLCQVCPCTQAALRCGYQLLTAGFGCAYDCAYCFLQEYQNIPGILFPDSLDHFFDAFSKTALSRGMFPRPRIGTGEFTDSLVYDRLTGFSQELVAFFRRRPEVDFEFKTKSTAIDGLLAARPAGNIVVSWTLSPAEAARLYEPQVPSCRQRLLAAQRCAAAGYRVGFHFDPIIHGRGWEKGYAVLIDDLFRCIPARDIAWISLGTLRCNPRLKKIVENRFPQSPLFDGEMLIDFDGKLRYAQALRVQIYRTVAGMVRRHSAKVKLYLCMESSQVWKASL